MDWVAIGASMDSVPETMLDRWKHFYSDEMLVLRELLQIVEWNIEVENGRREILSIIGLGDEYRLVELTGKMCTAYGTGCSYIPRHTYGVEVYSFEFNSLVGSYPARENKITGGNREWTTVGLVHSLVLAKHLGVEKLKAIGQYYDDHQVPVGRIRRDAFKKCWIRCGFPYWMMQGCGRCLIPLIGRCRYFRIECRRWHCGTRQQIGVCCKGLHHMMYGYHLKGRKVANRKR